MSDHQEIDSLLHDQKIEEALSNYVDAQFEFINDIQMGNYSSGMVTFDTLSLRDKWVHWRDSYIAMPINIQSSNANALATTDIVTVKRAVTDFIYGLTLTTGTGATIISDTNIVTINQIRLLIESSFEQWQEEGAQLLFSKDRVAPDTTAFGTVSAPDVDVAKNPGFAERAGWFKQACAFDSTKKIVSTVVFIPLRYIHDFFMQLGHPIINLRLQMSFLLNMYSNGSIVPALGGLVDKSVDPVPAVTIGTATIPGSAVSLTNCRLYYKRVTYHPEVNMMLAQKLASGFTKFVDFRCTDTYLPLSGEVGVSGGSITKLVSPSTIRPLRVWLLAPPTTALSSSTPDGTSGKIQLATYVGAFTNANCLVNNSRYYNNDLVCPADFYNILKEQFPEKQGLLSYSDFLTTYRLHCFDLTRLKDRLKNPNEAVSLQINASRVDSNAVDYYFIVERLQRVSLHMSSAESSVVVGLNQ